MIYLQQCSMHVTLTQFQRVAMNNPGTVTATVPNANISCGKLLRSPSSEAVVRHVMLLERSHGAARLRRPKGSSAAGIPSMGTAQGAPTPTPKMCYRGHTERPQLHKSYSIHLIDINCSD